MYSWRRKCANVPQTSAVKNPCVALHILVRCSFSWLRSVIHSDHRKPVTAHAQGERKTEKCLCREKGIQLPEYNIQHFTTVKQPSQFTRVKLGCPLWYHRGVAEKKSNMNWKLNGLSHVFLKRGKWKTKKLCNGRTSHTWLLRSLQGLGHNLLLKQN